VDSESQKAFDKWCAWMNKAGPCSDCGSINVKLNRPLNPGYGLFALTCKSCLKMRTAPTLEEVVEIWDSEG
jgi:hypothetical protein